MEFRRTKTYDLLAAGPLIGLYAFGSWGLWLQASAAMRAAIADGSAVRVLDAAALFASLAFVAFQAVLFIVRREPVLFSQSWFARGIAVVAANLPVVLLLVPRDAMPPALHAISGLLIVIGTIGAIWAAFYLGRAFSILPQARQLATSGPYRLVRHPLYLFEIIAMLGVALQFRQPWAMIIFVVDAALQILRIGHEERVLAQAFPDYPAYAAKTSRLFPALY